jgi:hypothetical protein
MPDEGNWSRFFSTFVLTMGATLAMPFNRALGNCRTNNREELRSAAQRIFGSSARG